MIFRNCSYTTFVNCCRRAGISRRDTGSAIVFASANCLNSCLLRFNSTFSNALISSVFRSSRFSDNFQINRFRFTQFTLLPSLILSKSIMSGINDHETPEVVNPDKSAGENEQHEDDLPNVSIAEVEIELTEDLKQKLLADLSSICSVDKTKAREMLENNKWNMQRAIDGFFDASDSDGVNDSDSIEEVPQQSEFKTNSSTPSASRKLPPPVNLDDVTSPEADSKKEKEVEIEKTNSSCSFSSWAPEKLSILSWNLDGLDEKNLEKRTNAVIELVLKEDHDVIFFQELLPMTFDYISRKICSKYMPIPGTEDPSCQYLTGTFLKLNHVHYEDHYIIPFPNTTMQRNLLVTKAFMGQAKFALLNSHLESTAEYSSQRREQLKRCFEIAQTFPPDYNVLFGGDLNLRDREVIGLMPADMCDLWVRCGSRVSCQYTFDLTRNTNLQMPSKHQPRCRFDRLYYRQSNPLTMQPEFFGVTGIEKVLGTQSFPSDHWGIISFFKLSKEARKPAGIKRKLES